MKAEELKSRIQFGIEDDDRNLIKVTGRLELNAIVVYDRRSIEASRDPARSLDAIKERICETIMREIYDDQRNELEAAIIELFKANPTDYRMMEAAHKRIMKAARFQ